MPTLDQPGWNVGDWAAPDFGVPLSTPSNYVEMSSMNPGVSAPAGGFNMGMVGPMMGIIGGLGQAFGAFTAAQSQADTLRFQRDMAAINARMAENTAQSILDAGNKSAGQVSLRAGKVKSSQIAGQGARGVAVGEGSAAEEVATTDLMKETDMLQINANAVRQAWAARTQSVNAQNESLLKGTTADSISPFSAMSTSLIGSATQVANSWYSNRKMNELASLFGGK